MNIGLAISGNLTGFSRFYANEEAKQLLNITKFNFDVHNLVSFLNNGEKLYAIFFSKDVVAVSLITNILDSFRRPGNLVVTVLIPRGYKIVDGLSSSRANALYHLLNEVNDKFYERNFLNGMVNQNPAVLMQDYYTEILSKFRLEPDSSQRKVNGLIDIASPNKKTGYISALERSIPFYLSSIFRKSYEGYHYIFLASNAPQNIDEPAEEIITYRVKIENKGKIVPGEVKLSDKIPFIPKSLGDKDIPSQDYTYEQVISGEAAPYITGVRTDGETIVLNYNFPNEEKTINFKFYDGQNEVPIHILRPRIESNGISSQLQSNSCLFRGKEIYEPKTIKSGVSEYTIERGSMNIDLQRVQDGGTLNIYVQHGWEMRYQFNDTFVIPKHIFLTNNLTGERREYKNVTTSLRDLLTGKQNEWVIEIYSEKFEPIQIPYGEDIHPTLKKKSVVSPSNTDVSKQNVNGQKIIHTYPANDGLKISSGNSHIAKDSEQIRREKNKRYMTYGIAAVVACLLSFGGFWCYKALFGDEKTDKPDKDDIDLIVDDNTQDETKNFALSFVGIDGDPLSQSTIDKLTLTFDPEQIVELNSDENGYCVKYNPNNNPTDKVKINVSYVGCDLLAKDYKNIFEVKDLPDVVTVNLSVKESHINLHDKIVAGVSAKDYDDYENKVRDIAGNLNASYGIVLYNLLSPQKSNNPETKKDDVRKDDAKKAQDTKTPSFDLGWTLSKVKEKKHQAEYQNYLSELTAIEKCLTGLKAGKIVIPEKLPNNFKEIMVQLKGLEDRIQKISDESKKSATKNTFIEVIKDKSESVNKERDNLVPGCKLDNRIRAAEK